MKTTNNKSGLIGTAVVLVILLAACIAVDAALPSYHIAITVIKKATVYSLVAVSMNLLNGFTGLFSFAVDAKEKAHGSKACCGTGCRIEHAKGA